MSGHERTALYRFFAEDGTLLYVGITGDLARRIAWHQANSLWFADHARFECVWLLDRATADAAETTAIQTEHPVHNVAKRNPSRELVTTIRPREWQEPLDAAVVAAGLSRDLEHQAWAAFVAAVDGGIPISVLCEETKFSRATFYRRYPRKKKA